MDSRKQHWGHGAAFAVDWQQEIKQAAAAQTDRPTATQQY